MEPLIAPPPTSSVCWPVPLHFRPEQWAALLSAVLFSPALSLQVLRRCQAPTLLTLSGPPRTLALAASALPAACPVLAGQEARGAAPGLPRGGAWYELRRRMLELPPSSLPHVSLAGQPVPAVSPASSGAVPFGAVDAQFIRLERVSAHGERASVRQRLRDLPGPSPARGPLAAWAEALGEPQVLMRHFTLFTAPAQTVVIPGGLEFVRAFAPPRDSGLSAPHGRWAHLMPDRWAAALLPTLPFASGEERSLGP